MKLLKIYPSSINDRFVDEAVRVMRDGGVVVFPTDTLYAIGCDALNNSAVQRVCSIKGIDARKESLSVVCADLSQASEYARIDNAAFRVVKNYLPGPYTFVLPASAKLPKIFKGRKEVGIRVPDNDITRALARALGNPVLSTSITWDADVPEEAVEPEMIAMRYSGIADLMIDGGDGSVEGSTVVRLTDIENPEIIRRGAGEFES